jgi:hypothetical protein
MICRIGPRVSHFGMNFTFFHGVVTTRMAKAKLAGAGIGPTLVLLSALAGGICRPRSYH